MPTKKLSDGPAGNVWRKAPPGKTLPPLHDTVCAGLELRFGPRGGSYLVSFRVKGDPEKQRFRRKLGTPKSISLPDVRLAAQKIIDDAKLGIHPDETKRKADAEARTAAQADARVSATTFLSVAEDYLADHLRGGGAGLASKGELKRKLMVDLLAWHAMPIAEIDDEEIDRLIRAKAQKHGASANRLLSFVKRVFAWAKKRKRITVNPAPDVDRPVDETPRKRVLDAQEVAIFWKACDRLGDPAGRLFKLCLATGQRRGEVAGLRRSELDKMDFQRPGPRGRDIPVQVDVWSLPEERTKRREAHVVPLSRLAKALIDGAPKRVDEDGNERDFDHIMPSGRRGDQPVSGWSRYKTQLDEAIGHVLAEEAGEEYVAETKDRPASHSLPDWHIHDLRATFTTFMMKPPLSVPRLVRSRILNHAEGDRSQTADYERYGWDIEAAAALEAWGQRLEQIITGADVVPFPGRQGA